MPPDPCSLALRNHHHSSRLSFRSSRRRWFSLHLGIWKFRLTSKTQKNPSLNSARPNLHSRFLRCRSCQQTSTHLLLGKQYLWLVRTRKLLKCKRSSGNQRTHQHSIQRIRLWRQFLPCSHQRHQSPQRTTINLNFRISSSDQIPISPLRKEKSL